MLFDGPLAPLHRKFAVNMADMGADGVDAGNQFRCDLSTRVVVSEETQNNALLVGQLGCSM